MLPKAFFWEERFRIEAVEVCLVSMGFREGFNGVLPLMEMAGDGYTSGPGFGVG